MPVALRINSKLESATLLREDKFIILQNSGKFLDAVEPIV